MKLFRLKFVIDTFALFTGIIFLNMSFVLAEVSALKMDKDQDIARAVSLLIAGSAAEEEPGASGDEDASTVEIDLICNLPTYADENFNPSTRSNVHLLSQGVPRLGNYEIYSPPPES